MDGYETMMPLDSPASWAAFLLWSVPLPLAIGGMLKVAEGNKKDTPATPASVASATTREAGEGVPGIQRNLMWAFPSFSCLLGADKNAQPPLGMSLPERWAWTLNSWGALGWYLYYKYKIEDELKEFTGEGLGGAVVVVPFALGLVGGLLGENLYGSLEAAPFTDFFNSLFYGGFAWIYVMQFLLYSKVNELYRSKGLTEPLLVWGLLVPGYNFVTGIRQIHFLSKFWALERGEEPQPDAFCELFPFSTKETLGVVELFTNQDLWVRWDLLGVDPPREWDKKQG